MKKTADMTYSQFLAKLALNTGLEDIPDSSYEAATRLLTDTLGCALAGMSAPGILPVAETMAEWGGRPDATILLTGKKVPAPQAAFANSALIHAMDYDDVYIPGTLHITSVVVPAVLAAAEMSGCSGREALAGMIMGIEIAGRIGIAEKGHYRNQGPLPSSMSGSFGAVAAAARILGLSYDECVNAMGINYGQLGGNRQALLDFSLTKRLQPGFAVRSALWSMELAQSGITGAYRVFEGEAGYFTTYLDGDANWDAFDREYPAMQVERVSIKKYPSCGASHCVQMATERLVLEENLKPEDIDRIQIVNCGPGGLVGNPFEPGEHPQVDAQFSVLWAVAHTILRGPVKLADYSDESVRRDTAVKELADQIEFIQDPPEFGEVMARPYDFPPYSSRNQGIVVYTKDGRRLYRTKCPGQTFGEFERMYEMVEPKFRDSAAYACDTDKAHIASVLNAISNFVDMKNVKELLDSLSGLIACRKKA